MRIGLCRFLWHGENSRIFSEFSSWIFSQLPSGIFPLRHALHSILCSAARKRQRFRDSRGSASAASSDTGRVRAFSLNSPLGFSLCCPRGFFSSDTLSTVFFVQLQGSGRGSVIPEARPLPRPPHHPCPQQSAPPPTLQPPPAGERTTFQPVLPPKGTNNE